MEIDIDRIQMESFYPSRSMPAFTSLGGSGDFNSSAILPSNKILERHVTSSSDDNEDDDSDIVSRGVEADGSLRSRSEKYSDTAVQDICDKYTKLAASMNINSEYSSMFPGTASSDYSKSSLTSDISPEFPYSVPSSYLSKSSTYPFSLDPDLNLTPDKRYTTFTTRLRSPSSDSIYHPVADLLRESRVRFDPDVAVHQLSPDSSSIAASSPNSSMLDSSPRSINYSSILPATSSMSGYSGRFTMQDDDEDDDDDDDDEGTSDCFTTSERSSENLYRDLTSKSWSTDEPTPSSLYPSSFPSSSAYLSTGLSSSSCDSPESSVVSEESYDEPVSVVASDLRKYSDSAIQMKSKSALKSGQHLKSHTAPAALGHHPLALSSTKGRRSWPESASKSNSTARGKAAGKSLQNRPRNDFALLKDFSPVESCECMCQASNVVDVEEESVLARPGLNSTLRVSRKLEKLKREEFNPVEALKSKVDPKTKQKIEEKVQAKLNVSTPQFSNLLSLEVRREDLLKKVALEKASQVKKDPSDRVRHEDLISRVPDIMDFFTDDLQKESVNHTLSGISVIPTPSRTVEPVRAFDVYRHIRQWRQW